MKKKTIGNLQVWVGACHGKKDRFAAIIRRRCGSENKIIYQKRPYLSKCSIDTQIEQWFRLVQTGKELRWEEPNLMAWFDL